jgi:zinc transport system substrate-binding protein
MRILTLALSTLLLSASSTIAEVNVVASIKPLHSLVASVMQGVGMPILLLDGNSSPHTYSLKPDDAKKLQKAQVVFWIGHELEAFLEKPLETLSQNATKVALIDAPDMKTLSVRESEHTEHHDHDEVGRDAHLWLDPENAKVMLKSISKNLSEIDPSNAKTYFANAEKAVIALDALSLHIAKTLAPARGKKFIVFHDAYQYFEQRFDVKSAAAISIHPENPPGAKQIAAIQKIIVDEKVQCVFAEPQFDNKLITVVTDGTAAKSATLDPIGSDLPAGPTQYAELMLNLATNFAACM